MRTKRYFHENFLLIKFYLKYIKYIPKILRRFFEKKLYTRKGRELNWLSLGETCLGAWILKEAGLRKYSGPFDWFTGFTLKERLEILKDKNFKEALNFSDLSFGKIIENEGTYEVRNERLNLYFPHDFKKNTVGEWTEVNDKYDRRLKRVRDKLKGGHLSCLYVKSINNILIDDEEIATEMVSIKKAYKMKNITLILMLPGDETFPYFDVVKVGEGVNVVKQYYSKELIPEGQWRSRELVAFSRFAISSYIEHYK